MKIPPSYTVTSELLHILHNIEALRIYFSSLSLPTQIKEKLQRVSLLKSSLFSARIEGNPLTMKEFEYASDREKKQEIFNIMKAIQFIHREIKENSEITRKSILGLHRLVLDGVSSERGVLRLEAGAIFNQAGVAVYVSPSPQHIPSLIDELLVYINKGSEPFPLVKAVISHLVFEKIHPFIDGNGRVGRLLILAILKSYGWEFPITVSFEEYIDAHKDGYYAALDTGLVSTQEYILFMLEAFLHQAQKVKSEVEAELTDTNKVYLPPRQEEIFLIIKDHKTVSFDFLRRRFLAVPPRTLRYDLEKLVQRGLVVKIGKTRGSYYTLK